MNKVFHALLFLSGFVFLTVAPLPAGTISNPDDYGYTYAGQFTKNQVISGNQYWVMDQGQTIENSTLRVGQNDSSPGNLYQMNGILHSDNDYPIIGQCNTGNEANPAKSRYQLSGTARAFIVGDNVGRGAKGIYMATAAYNVATLEVMDSARAWIMDIRFGSGSGYKSSAYVIQSGGTVFAPNITRASVPVTTSAYPYDYQYQLSGGELFVGTIGDNDKGIATSTTVSSADTGFMQITGGTLAFEKSAFPIVNQGGTIEIYGNLQESLTRTQNPDKEPGRFAYAKFKADMNYTPAYTQYGTSTITNQPYT